MTGLLFLQLTWQERLRNARLSEERDLGPGCYHDQELLPFLDMINPNSTQMLNVLEDSHEGRRLSLNEL